ncbi:fas-associated death domain protein [Bacillus rossius redtenbacheri]|uniref:fas-associated death domain protein n=1 Tax=Bacillus rossius redtenbacheri TaxID=93214 RepID=UPI002FDDB0F0
MMTRYEEIRDEVVCHADSIPNKLDEFKIAYQLLINSNRVTSKIRTFKDLITVLEKRFCLSEDNIEILYYITSRLNLKSLLLKVRAYEANSSRKYVASSVRDEFQNGHKFIRLETLASVKQLAAIPPQPDYNLHSFNPRHGAWSSGPTAPAYGPRIPPEAFELISEEIGSAWKQFARLISVKEGEIDELISREDMSIKFKLIKCLELFEGRTQYFKVRSALQKALCNVRRNDVAEITDQVLINAGF